MHSKFTTQCLLSSSYNRTVIEHALRLNGIPCLRIDQKRNKQSAAKVFTEDPNIRVLLLHGERENAGLNIVCASRVFLVESVVNHAFEVQGMIVVIVAKQRAEIRPQQLRELTEYRRQRVLKVSFGRLLLIIISLLTAYPVYCYYAEGACGSSLSAFNSHSYRHG